MPPMRLLILGGTVFLGRALTDAALAAGHSVTHLHRAGFDEDANLLPPPEPLPESLQMELCGPLKSACEAVVRERFGVRAAVEWLDDAFLLAQGVAPWKDMPLWIPESDEATHGLMSARIDRALDAGLAFRPLGQTVADTLAWHAQRPASHEWKAGITAERERRLLAAWKGSR